MKLHFRERLARSFDPTRLPPSNAHAYRLLIFKELPPCGALRCYLQRRGEILSAPFNLVKRLVFIALRCLLEAARLLGTFA
ncbi:MAG: hypothetical protein MK041_04735 [Aquabacterium sp.]|nr:hypothetical protein [Aquabacterium sp.]